MDNNSEPATATMPLASPPTCSDTVSKGDPADCCVICLDSITDKAAAIPCGHAAFDFLCLASWLQQRSTCPLCTADVATIHYSTPLRSYTVTSTKPPPPLAAAAPQPPRHPPRPRRPHTRHAPPAPAPDAALARRRAVYAHARYALHVGSNPLSRFRDFTPSSFARSPLLQSRARAWIRRELRVFAFLSPDSTSPTSPTATATATATAAGAARRADNAEFLLEYTISILKTLDVQGAAGQAAELLREFLGAEHAGLFLHELRAWLRSPFARVEDWDRNVQYAGEERRRGDAPCGEAGRLQNAGDGEGRRRGCGRRGELGERHVREARRRYAPD